MNGNAIFFHLSCASVCVCVSMRWKRLSDFVLLPKKKRNSCTSYLLSLFRGDTQQQLMSLFIQFEIEKFCLFSFWGSAWCSSKVYLDSTNKSLWHSFCINMKRCFYLLRHFAKALEAVSSWVRACRQGWDQMRGRRCGWMNKLNVCAVTVDENG